MNAHFRRLERLYHAAPCNAYYRPRLEVSHEAAEVTVEVAPEFLHAAGAVHGSVYFKLLDDAAFFAVNSIVEEVFVLTSQFNLHLLRPVQSGRLTARGRLTHRSKRLFLAESELTDDAGRPLALGSGTFMRSEIALDGLG